MSDVKTEKQKEIQDGYCAIELTLFDRNGSLEFKTTIDAELTCRYCWDSIDAKYGVQSGSMRVVMNGANFLYAYCEDCEKTVEKELFKLECK